MADNGNKERDDTAIARRLKRERAARAEAERIAEDATRRLYRQQRMLSALVSVVTTANETDSIADSSRQCLKALAENTVWKRAHAFYVTPDHDLRPVAWLGEAQTPGGQEPKHLISARAREMLETATSVTTEFLGRTATDDKGRQEYVCVCSISAGGRCYGVIEAFSDRPDNEADFTRELLEDTAQQLGYVYRREWEGHATEHFAYHDPLTGIGNRLLFFDRLQQAIRLCDRENRSLGLVSIDIDDLKKFNDSAGHAAGDEYLQLLAKRIDATMRDSDTVARLGGDEFAVILGFFDRPDAGPALVERLMAGIEKPARIAGRTMTPSVSIGLAVYPDDATTLDALLHCADSAMYGAKAAGGARILAYAKEG